MQGLQPLAYNKHVTIYRLWRFGGLVAYVPMSLIPVSHTMKVYIT